MHVHVDLVDFGNRLIAVLVGSLKNSLLDFVSLITKIVLQSFGHDSVDLEVDKIFCKSHDLFVSLLVVLGHLFDVFKWLLLAILSTLEKVVNESLLVNI